MANSCLSFHHPGVVAEHVPTMSSLWRECSERLRRRLARELVGRRHARFDVPGSYPSTTTSLSLGIILFRFQSPIFTSLHATESSSRRYKTSPSTRTSLCRSSHNSSNDAGGGKIYSTYALPRPQAGDSHEPNVAIHKARNMEIR